MNTPFVASASCEGLSQSGDQFVSLLSRAEAALDAVARKLDGEFTARSSSSGVSDRFFKFLTDSYHMRDLSLNR